MKAAGESLHPSPFSVLLLSLLYIFFPSLSPFSLLRTPFSPSCTRSFGTEDEPQCVVRKQVLTPTLTVLRPRI